MRKIKDNYRTVRHGMKVVYGDRCTVEQHSDYGLYCILTTTVGQESCYTIVTEKLKDECAVEWRKRHQPMYWDERGMWIQPGNPGNPSQWAVSAEFAARAILQKLEAQA